MRRKGGIMPLAFEDSHMRALYNVALCCCGTKHSRGAIIGEQFNVNPSRQRMQMVISLAMEHSSYFRSYAEGLVDTH